MIDFQVTFNSMLVNIIFYSLSNYVHSLSNICIVYSGKMFLIISSAESNLNVNNFCYRYFKIDSRQCEYTKTPSNELYNTALAKM